MNKKNKEITYNELAKAMEDALAKLVEIDDKELKRVHRSVTTTTQ